jgi:hypothetical protein
MDINGALHLGNSTNDQIYEPISADIYDHTVSDDENEFFNDNEDNEMIVDDRSYSPHHDRESSPINHPNIIPLNKKSINTENIFRLLNPHEVFFLIFKIETLILIQTCIFLRFYQDQKVLKNQNIIERLENRKFIYTITTINQYPDFSKN